MNSPTSLPIRQLLDRCLVDNDGEAWSALLARYAELVRRTFGPAKPGLAFEEFWDDFPGTLLADRKLRLLNQALLTRHRTGELATLEAEEDYARNYMVGVVRSAIGEWFRRNRPFPAREVPPSELPPEVEFGALVERIREELLRLPRDLRVPFWLRHHRAFGPLPPDDATWVAGQFGGTTEDLTRALNQEADGQSDPDRSLSSRFIGVILGLPPLSNGKAAAVDQRISRARELLRSRLRPEE